MFRRLYRVPCLLAGLWMGMASAALGQQQRLPRNAQGMLENTNAFAVAYAMSFQSYDTCGDTRRGEIAREAILQKLMACPFTPDAKAHFQEWLAVALPKMEASGHGLRNSERNCAAIRANRQYSATIAGLDHFQVDKRTLPSAVGFPCDMIPVFPYRVAGCTQGIFCL